MNKRTIIRTAVFSVLPRITRLNTLAILVAMGAMSIADGAEWRIEPVVRVAADFDDNPFLSIRTDTDENVSGYIVEGAANIVYAADRTNFSITPLLRSRAYDEDLDLDTDDQFLTMNLNTRTISTDFRVRGSYSRENTRTAERADAGFADADFDIENPDDILENDSGRVGIQDRRERLVLSPSVLYRVSSLSAVTARLDYQDVDYDEAFAGILTDYTDTRLSLSYSRAFSQRNTAIVGATYRTFETDDSNSSVDGIGFNIGFDRRLSETTRFLAKAGLEDTELIGADNELAWVADLSLSRQLETISLLAQYRRSVSASGSGQLGARDSVNFNFSRKLNDKITAGLGARIYSTKAVNQTAAAFDNRDYVQLRSQFIWSLSEVLSVEAEYRYTVLDREQLGESSNSNQVTIWLTYQPRPVIRSR